MEKINKLNIEIEKLKEDHSSNLTVMLVAGIFIAIFSFAYAIFSGAHDIIGLYGVLMISAAAFLICVVAGFIYKKATAKKMYEQVYYLEQEKKKLLNYIEKMK